MTTPVLKERYVDSLRRCLADKQLSVTTEDAFITSNHSKIDGVTNSEATMRIIYSQMEQFHRIVDFKDDNPFHKARAAFTGKSSSGKDDLLFALMMSLYWNQLTRASGDLDRVLDELGLVQHRPMHRNRRSTTNSS